MKTSIKPVFFSTKETSGFLTTLSDDIKNTLGNDADILLEYPTIYLHIWRNKANELAGKWSVYVGESTNVVTRTKEHYDAAKGNDQNAWQKHLINDKDINANNVVPELFIFGHKHFNKSLTLDIENRLIDYCLADPKAVTHNGRGNPQGKYSNDDEFDAIFGMIWRKLMKTNSLLFLPENKIIKSAIYKASPNHKLTVEQEVAKAKIISSVYDAVINSKTDQIVMVEGEAGTGKTVLTSSTFYELIDNDLYGKNINCKLLVNHNEQLNVYQNMAKKLGLDDDTVMKPIQFLNKNSKKNRKTNLKEPSGMIDVVFVDESHLLLTQNTQEFSGAYASGNQLEEIRKRARVVVIMYDENQILTKKEYEDVTYMDLLRHISKCQGANIAQDMTNHITLSQQLRMNCDDKTMKWIDDITKNLKVSNLILNSHNADTKNYEVKIFDDPALLEKAIKKKANQYDSKHKEKLYPLSRIIATYDWDYRYKSRPRNPNTKYWEVKIGNWSLPWNREHYKLDIKPNLTKGQKKSIENQDWAEADYSLDEVGSTFTIQGFDLDYAGVIIGPSVRYDKVTNSIYFDESKRAWDQMKGKRTLKNGKKVNVTNTLSKHELRVLLTRATRGLYIYACDPELRDALKKSIILK